MRHGKSRGDWRSPLVSVLVSMALVLAAGGAARGGGVGENLLPAGGFAKDVDGDGLADGWHFSGDEGVRVRFSLDPGQHGPCQRIECTGFRRVSPSSHVLVWTPAPSLREGSAYELSFSARSQGLTQTPVNVSLLETEPTWTPVGLLRTFVPPAAWRRYRFRFEATKTTGEDARLQFWFLGTGVLWLEDLRIVELEPTPARFTETVPEAGGRNLVPNSSFELGTIGWGSFAPIDAWGGNLNTLVGMQDPRVAAVHRSSLRVTLQVEALPVHFADFWDRGRLLLWTPLRQVFAANRGWLAVRPGEAYTLSAYLRADVPGLVARLQVRESEWTAQEAAVEVGTEWRRYSFTCRPGAAQVFVCIGPDLVASNLTEATLWIDAVQFEAGGAPTAYEPRAVVEVGLRPAGGVPIFSLGEPAGFEVVAFNASREPRDVAVRCRLSDFRDQESEITRILRASPEATVTAPLELDSSRREFYRITLAADGAAVVSSRPWRAAVLDNYIADDSLYGINHAYPWPQLLALSRQAGILWVRDWSLKWQTVESEPGRFDFGETDAVIGAAARQGMRILGLLAFPSSNWSSSAPADVQPQEGPEIARRMVYMPRSLEEFARYVRATAEHYRGRVTAWEILNEPVYCRGGVLGEDLGYTVGDYVLLLLQVAHEAIKAVAGDATVVGGLGGGPETYTREFIEAGGLAFVDALNLHLYPELAAPEVYIPALEELARQMREDGRPRPIWVTECGYYADDDPPVEPQPASYPAPVDSEREAAILQARFNLILLGLGARKIFYHCGTCGSINNESLYGPFFEYDAQPRKVLAMQAAMAQLLGPDTEPLGRLRAPEGAYAWAYFSGGRTVVAAWAPDGGAVLGRLPPEARLVDILGNPLPFGRRELTEEPIYLILPGRVAPGRLSGLVTTP